MGYESKDAYVAWTNTDLTEGKGYLVPKAISFSQATVERLGKKGSVQGCDCQITKETLLKIDNQWYGPIKIESPNKADDIKQEKIDRRKEAEKKALELGLTGEDIIALRI